MSDVSRRGLLGLAAGAAGACAMQRLFVPPAYAAATTQGGQSVSAYVNFAINVQNFRYLDDSVWAVNSLAKVFEKYRVKGDFYFTGPMARKYAASAPNAVARLRKQGIAYHVRPPHPLYDGFDDRLEGQDAATLAARIEKAETQSLNLETAKLNPDKAGGYARVKAVFRRAPSTVAAPNPDKDIKYAALDYYKAQGARGVVWYHGEKDLGADPYQRYRGLLARPCDVCIDEWSYEGTRKVWWNNYERGVPEPQGRPRHRLKNRIASFSGKRPPHVVALFHDDNLTRKGPDAWLNTFWKDKAKSQPRTPPYDLDAKDPSSNRGKGERERILQAYEDMVAWAAENARVVTMDDIVKMAG